MASTAYKPPWWLCNRHLQSLYGTLVGARVQVSLRWEELDLPDGDFLDICWAGQRGRPLVILLHGLEGSANSHYIQAMLHQLLQHDYQAVVMNYRTCSGRLNRLPHSYNGGDYRDFAFLVKVLQKRYPQLPKAAVGFSLGGNILLRYMAHHHNSPLRAGIAISSPYDLRASADYLAPFYQQTLLRTMKRKIMQKISYGLPMPATADEVKSIFTLREFDEVVTAPLYQFRSADHYYRESSCGFVLKHIEQPVLILHAIDDPFVPPASVPTHQDVATNTQLEVTEGGGHVGFIKGGLPWRPEYWFNYRVPEFLRDYLR